MDHLPKRATLVRLAAIGALSWVGLPTPGLAQTQEKPIRVGLIEYGDSELSRNNMRLLLDGLRERGYVEGKNLVFERRHAEGLGERMPEIANELVALKLDVIVTTCTPSTRLMYSKTQTVPLVMASVSDPVGQKLIASYAHPGGNITGLASQFEDIAGKMLELFEKLCRRPRMSPCCSMPAIRCTRSSCVKWKRQRPPSTCACRRSPSAERPT